MKKSKTFKILNDKGEEVECNIKFLIESEEAGKSYIVFTDGTVGEDEKELGFASVYDINGENEEIRPIESEKEWDLIYSVYESLRNMEEVKENE